MALSKKPFSRYQVINQELRRKEWVKTSEFQRAIEYSLGMTVSAKMIQNDLSDMRDDSALGYFAPIKYNQSEKAWYYEDREYTIQAFGLKDEDLNALKFHAAVLNQYRQYSVFEDLGNAIDKVLAATALRSISSGSTSRQQIQTEYAPPMKGNEWIPEIIRGLNENKKLRFVYRKYGSDETKTLDFEPYLLKEDRHRWYLLGRSVPEGNPTWTYGLDRILELDVLSETFDPVPFAFEAYYAHTLGITVPDENPLEVVLSFTPKQGEYLQSLPLHPSQKELINDSKEYRISIYIKPTWEFYEKILGYGANVQVRSPQSVIGRIKQIAAEVLAQYQ